MCKRTLLFKEIIFKHHPEFRKSRTLKRLALSDPKMFNVEHLIEECFAIVGPYVFIDGDHADFSDGSDSKTASIREAPDRKTGYCATHRGEIGGVETAGGGQKTGALRCIIYNPHLEKLMYYYLPKSMWENSITIHPSSKIGKIMFSYNRVKNYIPKFSGYECSDFIALATK